VRGRLLPFLSSTRRAQGPGWPDDLAGAARKEPTSRSTRCVSGARIGSRSATALRRMGCPTPSNAENGRAPFLFRRYGKPRVRLRTEARSAGASVARSQRGVEPSRCAASLKGWAARRLLRAHKAGPRSSGVYTPQIRSADSGCGTGKREGDGSSSRVRIVQCTPENCRNN